MAQTNMPKPGKNGYKIVFATNTIVMNYKFAAAAGKYDTAEYRLMKKIHKDFPSMTELVVSGREKKSTATNTRLTYENMETHISAYENADELLEVFKTVKAASATVASPYKYVADWFKAQFPDYKTAPMLKDGHLAVVPVNAPEIKEYKQKIAKAG